MTSRPDVSNGLSRERLCDLAGVERARHRRWQEAQLLERRAAYGELDLVKAAALNELWRVLKPQAATIVWRQIGDDLGHPGRCLDAVVDMTTRGTALARTAAQLNKSVPRGVDVRVIDLATPIATARCRLAEYRTIVVGASAVSKEGGSALAIEVLRRRTPAGRGQL